MPFVPNFVFPTRRRRAAVLLLSSTLTGCATLPSNGPTAHDIVREQAQANPLNFNIVDINAATVQRMEEATAANPSRLAALAATGSVDTIGPGDVLSIQLFEVGTSLFTSQTTMLGTPGAAMSTTGSSTPLGSSVTVDRDGAISVPYAGRIMVAGMTTEQVEQRIEAGLVGLSQRPQVLVSIRDNLTNAVVVMGSILRPGRQPLTLAREHLLDAIATAGGINTGIVTGASTGTGTGPQDMIIRFTRGGRTVEQAFETIESGSPDDLLLLPGDRIEVLRQPRSFIVFGATARVSQLPFESRVLSLAEAVARVGGPNDSQADPTAVFVFRYETGASPTALDAVAPVPGTPPKPVLNGQVVATPVIYRLNLKAASGYFLAQRFQMRDKDVIYIANARANQPRKLVEILTFLFSPILAIRSATR